METWPLDCVLGSSRELVSGRPLRAPEDAQGQSSLRDMWLARAMISTLHDHLWGVALVTCRNQTAEEQRVALLEVGEDAELLQALIEQVIFDTHDDWTDLVQCR